MVVVISMSREGEVVATVEGKQCDPSPEDQEEVFTLTPDLRA